MESVESICALTVPASDLDERNVFAFNLERPKSQTCN